MSESVTPTGAAPEAPPASTSAPSGFAINKNLLVRVVSVIVTLVIWEIYGRGVDPLFFSYPTAIVEVVPSMIKSGELQAALLSSLTSLVIGFSLAVVFGVALGLLKGRYRTVDNSLDVQISALYATPNVALIPLIILWFGLGASAKIFIVFMAAFFPIVVNTHSGVRNISRGLMEVAQAEGASELQIFSTIVVPASLPFIMTGIRLAVGRAVVGMVVGEMFTAVNGLGGAIITYGNAYATSKLFVVVILLAVLGVALSEIVRMLERVFAPWKETERA